MKTGIDAITGSTVQVQAYMQIVLVCHGHQVADLLNSRFVDMVYFFSVDRTCAVEIYVRGISNGNADKIKSPVTHPFKMILLGEKFSRDRFRRKKIEQVKTLPLGQFITDW